MSFKIIENGTVRQKKRLRIFSRRFIHNRARSLVYNAGGRHRLCFSLQLKRVSAGQKDYVVLRTMLLFSRVDVTLHAGGGDAGWVQRIWATER